MKVQELLRHPINILALAAAVALTAIFLAPWIIAAALAGEIIYLTIALVCVTRKPATTQTDAPLREAAPKETEHAANTPSSFLTAPAPRAEQAEALSRLLALRLQSLEIHSQDLLNGLQELVPYAAMFEATEQEYLREADQIRQALEQKIAAHDDAPDQRLPRLPLTGGLDFSHAPDGKPASLLESSDPAAAVAAVLTQIVRTLEEIGLTRSHQANPADDERLEAYTEWLIDRKARMTQIKSAVQDLQFRSELILMRLSMTTRDLGVVSLKQVVSDVNAVLAQCRSLDRQLASGTTQRTSPASTQPK